MVIASSEYSKLQDLIEEREKLEIKLNEKMERWIYLSELSEKIEEQNKE